MKEYFGLQYRMTNRKFKDAGLEPLLAYILVLAGFIALSVYLFYKTEFAQYLYVLISLTISGTFLNNRRNEFLKITFGDKKFKKIRITENLLLATPFLIFLLGKGCYFSAATLLPLTVMMAFSNFSTNITLTLWTPFSKRPFEFIVGFRKSFYLIAAAYALTIIAIFVNNFNLGIFAMLVIFAITLGYYTKPENEYYVWVYQQTVKQFLFGKLKTAFIYSSLLLLPIFISLGIFFPQQLKMLALFLIVGYAFLICMIMSKYAAFPDELNIVQAILLALCLLFPPLLIILIPYLFLKSEKRLSHLLQ